MGRRHNRQLFSLFVLVTLFFLIGSFLIVERNVKPVLMTIAEAKARILAIQTINSTINKGIVASVSYQDLINIHKDVEGKIALIQPNTVEISRLAATASALVQEQLEALESEQVYIPTGQILGSVLLANVGPRIRVSIVPLGTVRVNLISNFEDAGINQTLHQLFLEIEADIQVVIPLARTITSVSTSVPLIHTVIIGKVPQHYWQLYRPDGG